jgi:hypothetical protein
MINGPEPSQSMKQPLTVTPQHRIKLNNLKKETNKIINTLQTNQSAIDRHGRGS